jgi:hypothetical protein
MPADAVYLQLPANLFWSSISPEVAPEPIDGFFLTRSFRRSHRDKLVAHLEVLIVLGIRRSRAGFSVIPLRSEMDPEIGEIWRTAERAGGDFSNTLPGGEISGLYSILTTNEVLKLLGRVLIYAERHPEDLLEVATAGSGHDGGAPLTHLSFTRITLGGEPRST